MKWSVVAPRVVAAVSTVAFIAYFDPAGRNFDQIAVDLLLVLAIAAWGLSAVAVARPVRSFPRLPLADLAVIVCVTIAFAALWMPHYDNWRWAYTGDSVAWFSMAARAAERGLEQNLLAMHGVDFHFTYLHSVAFNTFMFVFEPTLFWHRAGKLVASMLSLSAIFLFFRVTVGRWWALGIMLCTAANYLWLWMSFVSYGHIDSFIYYFNGFTLAALIWRRRDDPRLWFLAGLNAGLSLYFTQTAWSGVGLSGLCLIGLGLRHRLFANMIVCGVTFGICGVPIVLQWSGFLHLISSQAQTIFEWEYLKRMFTSLIVLPFKGMHTNYLGVVNGFLRPPLSESYVIGGFIGLAALVPAMRRFLRLPRVVPAMAVLLLFDIILLTLTNNGYPWASPKRAYNLIPTQIFLAVVPGIVLYELLSRWRATRPLGAVIVIGGLSFYIYGTIGTLLYPPDFTYASTTIDGFIELHQRHGDRHFVYFTTSEIDAGDYAPEKFFNRSYGISASVTPVMDFTAARLEQSCRDGRIVCGGHHREWEKFEAMQDTSDRAFIPYPTVNSRQLRCFECGAPGTRKEGDSEQAG
jgi:hypothetical protein